jgi:hypothetical protein
MFTIRPGAVAVLAAVALSSCGVASAMKASPEREADADALLADIGAGRADIILGKMSSENSPAQVRAQLPFLKTLTPTRPVPAGTTAGWRANVGTAGSTYELSRSYEYPDRTLTMAVIFKKEGEAWKVLRFNLNVTLKEGTPAPDAAGREGAPAALPVEPAPKAA